VFPLANQTKIDGRIYCLAGYFTSQLILFFDQNLPCTDLPKCRIISSLGILYRSSFASVGAERSKEIDFLYTEKAL